MDSPLDRSFSGGVAVLTLSSPHNRNALSSALRAALIDSLRKAIGDGRTRVVVLRHIGTSFCSGMDLKEAAGAPGQINAVSELAEIIELMMISPIPIVAAVEGAVRGGGLGIVAAADIAIASAKASFAITEVRIGAVAGVISIPVLMRLDSRSASELFLTGEVFGADRAAECGLISRVIDDAAIDDEVNRCCSVLQLGGPSAIAVTRGLLFKRTSGLSPKGLADELARMVKLSAVVADGVESAEGRQSFLKKRVPDWVAN